MDVTIDRAAKRANENSVLEHEHEYAITPTRNAVMDRVRTRTKLLLSLSLSLYLTMWHVLNRLLTTSLTTNPTDRASFIHMQS
ncbi:PREDICTED: uncharacterized protein LOC105145174 isoform X3 [Acromyrmex echinatior]|uniref:uncharacterized protein LOC105145174 isoform X3 n=1 Tax=Acromyrmex echinatior TaxID=103372 RepID=UPI000580C180|nr:PREDICTED: uncharacterized protein LOC105145174 isoform X3 [Acromyrmex echinatior]